MAAMRKAETQSELSHELSLQCRYKEQAKKNNIIFTKIK